MWRETDTHGSAGEDIHDADTAVVTNRNAGHMNPASWRQQIEFHEGAGRHDRSDVYEWSFRLGPGFIVGVGNGLILGWLMYTSGLLPRRMTLLGLIGGPLLIIAGTLVIFDVIEASGPVQGLMTIPEALWELSIGIYLIVKGYKPTSPVLAGMDQPVRLPDSASAEREGI